MKIKLLLIGKTDEEYLKRGLDKYDQRLKHYIPVDITVIPDLKKTKNLSEEQQKQKD